MNSPAYLFGRLHEVITAAERVLLVAHKKPDGDTLGSSSSLLNWLLREGKDVTAFCADQVPKTFFYLDSIQRYTTDSAVFDKTYDVVIVFDSGDLRYCGVDHLVSRLPPGYLLVNIDHHITNQHYGQLNIVLHDASSTAEVMQRFYEACKLWVDERMATSILTGLVTDTSSFSNAATNHKSLEGASQLLAAGARLNDILRHVMFDKTVSALRLWGLLLSRLRHNPVYDVVSTYVLKEEMADASSEVVEGLSNFLNRVTSNTDTILVLRELSNGTVKGSFRSVARDVSKIARLMGGGGHKKAAGFTLAGRLEETSQGLRVRAN